MKKRLFDLVAVWLSLPLWLPLLLVLALLVRFKLGAPIFFRQARPGRGGQPFRLTKFRTMTDARDAEGEVLADAQRLTALGRWLRATSLDELPELWHVLTGKMSLVGPRPLLVDYLPLYTPRQARRHEVRPGLTGWAQIHGRNQTDWATRLALDVWYVENQSLRLDLRILLATLGKVLRREGVAAHGEATMSRFCGAPDVDAPIFSP